MEERVDGFCVIVCTQKTSHTPGTPQYACAQAASKVMI